MFHIICMQKIKKKITMKSSPTIVANNNKITIDITAKSVSKFSDNIYVSIKNAMHYGPLTVLRCIFLYKINNKKF